MAHRIKAQNLNGGPLEGEADQRAKTKTASLCPPGARNAGPCQPNNAYPLPMFLLASDWSISVH